MEASSPIFVIGSYRSGTSIFGWCLGQHPNIVNLPETNWLARFALELDEIYRIGCVNGKHSHIGQLKMDREDFYRMFGAQVDGFINETNKILIGQTEHKRRKGAGELRRQRSPSDPKQRWVDATPENTHFVAGLKLLFPKARFIHLLRNPHDVARSLENFSKVGNRDYSEREAYETWTRLVSSAEEVERGLGPQQVLRVNFKELMSDPEQQLRRVFEFLDEEYCADSLLPLQKKINSSEVVGSLKPISRKPYVHSAEILFERLANEGQYQGESDDAASQRLEQQFRKKIDALHDPGKIAVRRVYLNLTRVIGWLRRRIVSARRTED